MKQILRETNKDEINFKKSWTSKTVIENWDGVNYKCVICKKF